METQNKFLNDDLIKYGILDQNFNLNPKINEKDYNNLISGGGLLVEKDKKAVLFSIDNHQLKAEVLNNDYLKHKNLSSAELLYLSNDNKILHKNIADYGRLVDFGKDYILGDKTNEKQFFAVLENERGKSIFYGNDLENKLANYKIGDQIQINTIGVKKNNIEFDFNGEKQTTIKYDNEFNVSNFNNNNKVVKNSLFEINSLSKVVKEIDTTNISIKSINGQYLDEKQVDRLKKGKSISLENGLEVQLSPNANNRFNMLANSKNLLIGSLLIDGGISFTLIKTIQLLNKILTDKQEKDLNKKYLNELNNLKGYLQQQANKYPADKKILDNINIVDKEIGSVNSIDPNLNKKASYTEARLDLKDFDVSADIQNKRDLAEREKIEQEKKRDGGLSR